MSENPSDHDIPEPPPQAAPGPEGAEPQLTEAEREMLEQQMREVRVEDLLTQTVASVLNLSARRIVKEDEVDLEQARIGIEAVRAIVPLLPAEVGEAVREPLSQVQMLYVQKRDESTGPEAQPEAGEQAPPETGGPTPPGGSGLWTPRGS
jgi:pyruvate/2-oxoglutarate dehydrogenase complex dihydrolipoamide acyltransferase (E2) component